MTQEGTIILHCNECNNHLGSLEVDEISIVSPEHVMNFLARNRIYFLCNSCNCEHSFEE